MGQIQHLYGKLYTLATAGGDKYAPYLTPDAADDLIDTDDSLLVVRVDLTGENPELTHDERGPVWITRYSDDLVEKVAHCYYQNRGSGIDHSIHINQEKISWQNGLVNMQSTDLLAGRQKTLLNHWLINTLMDGYWMN